MINYFLIKNPKTNRKSISMTLVVIGFSVINLKLLVSGITVIDRVTMSEFSGVDYAAALTAISALWLGNKHINNSSGKKEEEQ